MPIPFLAIASVASSGWGMIPRPAKIAMGGALALFVAYQAGHWRGDNYRNAKWEQKIEAEREKQEQIVTRSENKALEEITRLNATVEEINALVEQLRLEADADANASRPALGAAGVQRLNRIGPRKAR